MESSSSISSTPKRCILFDWGGTLAFSKHRQQFVDGTCTSDDPCLMLDTAHVLKMLKANNLGVGIISNTSVSEQDMWDGLETAGLKDYVDFVQVAKSGEECAKPKPCAFLQAKVTAEKLWPIPSRFFCSRRFVFIGNQLTEDIEGPSKIGMYTCWIVPANRRLEVFGFGGGQFRRWTGLAGGKFTIALASLGSLIPFLESQNLLPKRPQ